MLGAELKERGWQVRGTSREAKGLEAVAAAGIEPALADPDRAGTILELVEDVAVVVWALGSATGAPEAVRALHGPRLERVLELFVDTPVRGFVYEGSGSTAPEVLEAGAAIVSAATERWRIRSAVVRADPADAGGWSTELADAVEGLIRA